MPRLQKKSCQIIRNFFCKTASSCTANLILIYKCRKLEEEGALQQLQIAFSGIYVAGRVFKLREMRKSKPESER